MGAGGPTGDAPARDRLLLGEAQGTPGTGGGTPRAVSAPWLWTLTEGRKRSLSVCPSWGRPAPLTRARCSPRKVGSTRCRLARPTAAGSKRGAGWRLLKARVGARGLRDSGVTSARRLRPHFPPLRPDSALHLSGSWGSPACAVGATSSWSLLPQVPWQGLLGQARFTGDSAAAQTPALWVIFWIPPPPRPCLPAPASGGAAQGPPKSPLPAPHQRLLSPDCSFPATALWSSSRLGTTPSTRSGFSLSLSALGKFLSSEPFSAQLVKGVFPPHCPPRSDGAASCLWAASFGPAPFPKELTSLHEVGLFPHFRNEEAQTEAGEGA